MVPGRRGTDGQTKEAGRAKPGRGSVPAPQRSGGTSDTIKSLLASVKENHVVVTSAGVAFFSFLALFPALIALISIYGLWTDPSAVVEQLERIVAVGPGSASQFIVEQFRSISRAGASGLTIGAALGIAGALWSASSGMKALMEGVDVAYGEEETRGFVKMRGTALLLTAGAILATVVAIGVIAVIPNLFRSLGISGVIGVILTVLTWIVMGSIVVVGLAAVYRYGPDRPTAEWSDVLPGAGLAVGLWLLGSIGFSIYASNFGSFNETYGSISAVIVLMLWLMLTSFSALVGAELNAQLEKR